MIERLAIASETFEKNGKQYVEFTCELGHFMTRIVHNPPYGWALDRTAYQIGSIKP